MKKYLSILIILFFFQKIISQCEFENKQLVIINEVGSFVTHPDTKHHINAEYIELLVLGDPNRPYSPVNIRGIIIDDNNIPVAEIGSEPGYIQLSDEFPLVYPGTLILIYDPDGYIVDESKDGEPNGSGVYQIPFNSPLIKKIEDKYFFPYNNYGYEKDTGWDGFIPFRNYGDIAQIISSKGKLIQGLSWNCCGDPFEYPEGSFFWNENLKNRTIQLTNGRYSDKTSYRISGYSSPGEPNTPENEEFINSLKNGIISAFGNYSVTVLKNQVGNEANACIEILLEGTSVSQTDWYVEMEGTRYDNQHKSNPYKIEKIYGGSKQIIVYIWNETLKQYCPFEKTIFIPTELEKRDDPVCKGECITLVSEGEYCVAWVDEKGRLLGNGIEYTICPENDITITEIIENLNGIVVKRIKHILQTKKSNYVLNTVIPEHCPPEEVILSISGTDISVTWADNGSEEKERKVTSPGKYDVSILDNKNNCTYQETFIVGEDIFKDSDGDGLCDDKDCYPSDPALIIEKGSPCDDNNTCTINDKYNENCECEGEFLQYGLSVEIAGGINICGQQTETELAVEATGGTEPYEILWSTGATTETIIITEISQGGGETYSVTVTDYNGCSQEASVQLTRYDSDDSDGDGYCDEIDCAPFSETLGGPGSPCDDGDPTTLNDVHDANCNCAGIPNPCDGIDLDGDGLCDCPESGGFPDPNALPPQPPVCEDCNDNDPTIGGIGSPCDDGNPETINDRMDETCNCIGEKKEKKYVFLVEGKYYFENNTVYVCPKNIPLNITVVTSDNSHIPVTDLCTWTINSKSSNEKSSTIRIELSDFIGDKSELTCKFTENISGNLIDMDIKISKDIKLEFKEDLKKYQYDDNNIQAYITAVGYGEKLGTPWNFIEASSFDKLKAKVSKSSGYYAVNDIKANNPNLAVTPTILSQNGEIVDFTYNGSGKQIIEINGCHRSDPELLLFTAPKKTYDVYFYRVCETDDDEIHYCLTDPTKEKNCTTLISSPDFVCIDGGLDKTIDEMNQEDIHGNSIITKEGDILIKPIPPETKYKVVAGSNLKCDHKGNPKGIPDCPGVFNSISYIQDANSIFAKAGVELIDRGMTIWEVNYNLNIEDGILDNDEQNELHKLKYGNSIPNSINVFIVSNLGIGSFGGTIQGHSTSSGFNTLSMINKAHLTTLAHEIGHATWSLKHPGCPCGTYPNGTYYNGEFGIDDYYNFMHGEVDKVLDFNVRRYQLDAIHK